MRKNIYMSNQHMQGLLFLCMGGVLVTIALGSLIFRLMLGLFGLWFMYQGVQLMGGPRWFYTIRYSRSRWW